MLHPTAIAYDAAGNLYVADANRQQVFEATLAGALVVIAGTGTQGFTGDGEQATAAQLNSPQGIAVAADGTLYIADTGNHRIRAVAGGLITTVAAVESPTALAVDSTGALLVCDSTRHRVLRIAGGAASTVAGSGTQGFAGDGGPAASAQIDTPSGLAVAVDGRIFIADTHNDRVRVIATDGTIATFAGTGLRGYSGDGGAAVRAQLSLPHGLAMTPMGALLVADSNNQRLRFVDATGIIHTLVGSGEQGIANDGSTVASVELNLPRSAAVDSFGSPVMVDAGDAAVRIAWNDGRLYAPAAFATGRTTAVTLSVPAAVSYGSSAAQFAVSGQAGAAVGLVQLLDAGTQVAKAALAQGAATFSLGQLGAGTHTLQGMYLGDGVNPSASSSVTGVTITPAVVTASADPQSILYGQPKPTLTGTSSGVLPQDAATVGVSFTTPAADMSPPGAYPITAALSGSAARNYSLVMAANSGLLRITQAPTTTVARPPSQSSYAGLPLQVVASVSPAYRGTPGGVVTFLEGGNVVATAALSGGMATGVYLAPTAGTHTLTASYPGDANFHASDSAVVTAVVGALPDFTVAATGTSSQTVQSGSVATYGFAVAGQQGAFSGAVSFSVAGLPAGATAAFSPQQTVPGAGSSAVVMTVQTPAQHGRNGAGDSKGRLAWLAMMLPLPLPLMLVGRRRRWRLGAARTCCLLWFALGITGCSERVLVESAAASQTYTLTVTGTGTNLAGAVVAHSCVFGLTIN